MKRTKYLLPLIIIPLGLSICGCSPRNNESLPSDDGESESEVIVNEHLSLNPTELTVIVGASKIVTATTDPAGQLVTWASENENIATVNRMGRVTGVAVGNTRISATLGNEVKYCNVTVKQAQITVIGSVNLAITLTDGELTYPTYQLNPTVDNEPVTCTYVSDNTNVASVDNDGLITAVGVGNAIITVTYGDASAPVEVAVTGPTGYYNIVSAQAAAVVADPGKWYMHTAGSASNLVTYHIGDHAHLEINASGARETFMRYQVPNFEVGDYYQFETKITASKASYVRVTSGSASEIFELSQGENDIKVYGRELLSTNCLGFIFLNSTSTSDYAKGITADIKDFNGSPSIKITTKLLDLSLSGNSERQIVVETEGEKTYLSENTDVATVSNTGLVTAVGDGTTKVWVNIGEAKDFVTVNVSGKRLVLSDEEVLIKKGANKTVSVDETLSKDIDVTNVGWYSEDEDVATVSNGVITAVNAGQTNIVATEDGLETKVSVIVYDDNNKLTGSASNFVHKKTTEMADVGPGWYKLNYCCNSFVMENGVVTLTNNDKTFKDVQQIRYLPDDGNGNVYHGRYYVVYTVTSGMQNSDGQSINMTCQSQGYNDTINQSELVTLAYGESATISHMVPAVADNMGFLVFKLKYPNGFGTITLSDIYIIKVN